MVSFSNNIFMLGCGGVAQCTLPLLLDLIDIAPSNVTIMDFVDNRSRVAPYLAQGVVYVQDTLTKDNYAQLLKKYLNPDDLFIDLSWNVDTCALLQWCHDNQVLYVNTSIEEWEPYQNVTNTPVRNLTLYYRHQEIKKMINSWSGPRTTAIVDHGANPGLVSHFTKQALQNIAQKILSLKKSDARSAHLERALADNNFAALGQHTGTKVIHISERDTQLTHKPKEVNEFVNTWSIEGFIEEGMAPAELGWGTHERIIPLGAHEHTYGPKNQILLASMGMNTLVRSWVPSGPILGMVIRHGEAYGISDRLTVWQDGKAVYRPTVHYAYCPCDSAYNSLFELRMRDFIMQPKKRILNDDIIKGADEVGCLLMGHDFNSWWIGSVLDIEQARTLVPGQNSTTLQVAISLVAAIHYAIEHPDKGFCLPDDIDHEYILAIAKPYLGTFISEPVNWTPLNTQNSYFVFGKTPPLRDDVWQFSTFLVRNTTY
ncbi:homospermidine synthase [Candidatus Dependentiae bacterium Noda2021]|nr:homospermidine synthase [Candidatus Dependentiae bacterium Noda2021]